METAILEELGFSKREIKAYIALLRLGSTTVGEIIKKTSIPSSKIYEVLNRLQNKGLVSYVIIRNIKHYQASDPAAIINSLDDKRKKVAELLPSLEAQKEFIGKRQSVEIYEGQKAIFSLFNSLIADAKPWEKYMVFSVQEEKTKEAHLFFKNLSTRRKPKKLDVLILRGASNRPANEGKHTKVKIRYTSFDFPEGMTIFQDNVILLNWTNRSAIRIQSKSFSKQFSNFFMQLWAKAKEQNSA